MHPFLIKTLKYVIISALSGLVIGLLFGLTLGTAALLTGNTFLPGYVVYPAVAGLWIAPFLAAIIAIIIEAEP